MSGKPVSYVSLCPHTFESEALFRAAMKNVRPQPGLPWLLGECPYCNSSVTFKIREVSDEELDSWTKS